MRLDLIAAAGGVILPFAFAPFGFSFLAPVAFLCLFSSWLCADPWMAFRRGFLFGLGFYGVGISWIFISLHHYGGAGLFTATLLTMLLIAFLALYPAAAGWLSRRFFAPSGAFVQCVLIFPASWVAMEWVRSWFLTGLPWLLVGYSQTGTPLKGLAPVAGTFGVSLGTTMVSGLLLAAGYYAGELRRLALLGILGVLGFAAWLDRVPWVAAAGPPFRAAVLQGNVPQDRKWEPDVRDATIQRYIDMTRSQRGAQLIVWPETAIPAFYQDIESITVPRLEADARQYQYDLVFGIPFYDGVADRYFNAVARLGQRRDFYFKRHLVPFGEYLPLRRLLGFMLKLLDVPLADFSPGDGRQPRMHAAGHGVAVTICYEDIFGQQALAGLPEAAYLLNVTNDAWFGNSTAPHQHWQMARMRAIEAGRYMVRAANTGVSGIADASGAVVALAPMFQQAAAAGLVVPLQGQTPYARFGDVPAIAVVAGILLLQGLWIQRRPNRP